MPKHPRRSKPSTHSTADLNLATQWLDGEPNLEKKVSPTAEGPWFPKSRSHLQTGQHRLITRKNTRCWIPRQESWTFHIPQLGNWASPLQSRIPPLVLHYHGSGLSFKNRVNQELVCLSTSCLQGQV